MSLLIYINLAFLTLIQKDRLSGEMFSLNDRYLVLIWNVYRRQILLPVHDKMCLYTDVEFRVLALIVFMIRRQHTSSF